MYKVKFNIIHKGCWGSEISQKFPEMKFSSMDVRWVRSNVAHILVADLLEAKGDCGRFQAIIDYLRRKKGVKTVETIIRDKQKIYIRTLTQHSPQHQQFSNLFFDNHLFMAAPVRFEDGYEKWCLATVDKKNIEKVYAILQKKYSIEIVYLKEESIVEDLTEKQREAITLAKHFGYYEWPRKRGITEIVSILKVPKTVFLSHLRKAENKIINHFFESSK